MPFIVIASLSSDCAKYYDQRLCLSACISQKNTYPNFTRVSTRVACDHGLFFSDNSAVCYGFVENIVFAHNGQA